MYDNRISLYSAQQGKCAITGKVFENINEMHCHHKIPKSKGGNDSYQNLVLICENIHKLIHASDINIMLKYLEDIKPNAEQLRKIIIIAIDWKKQ